MTNNESTWTSLGLGICASLSVCVALGPLAGCSNDTAPASTIDARTADAPLADDAPRAGDAPLLDASADAAVPAVDAGPPADAPPFPSISLGLAPVATGLSQPTVIVTPPGETRFFVAERTGTVAIIEAGTKRATPFIDVHDIISLGDEQGLVGLVFHPGYATNGRVFVFFTGADPDVADDSLNNLHIWEYHRKDGDPNAVDAGHKVILAVDHHQFPEHNGGNMRFGPKDGYLYVGIGDGGDMYDTVGSSRILTTRLSKILRLDVDHGDPYQPAPGNPFASMDDPAAKDIWMWGLRNPWRWSFDRQTGDLWIGDVGQNCWEEIDHAAPGQSGLDFGWALVEGMGHTDHHCLGPPIVDPPGATMPVLEYQHDDGSAVVGGYVYRGAAIPELNGMYFFSDYGRGFLHSFWAYAVVPTFAQTMNWTDQVRQDDPDFVNISTFGEDPAGELLACSIITGKCWRIVKK